ncbi:CAP domain-containing protein [Streptomyces sp. SCSIO 30461]|uniref:CAP domain-containing protein n=1 Tax=Streptomyces sp. SCSIO 30461 TaxID=3118085 RepID=UPI0030D5F42A
MSNHRRKTYYRKITIAAVAVAAVGVPSAAMACMDEQDDRPTSRGSQWQGDGDDWKTAASDQRWNWDGSHEKWWHKKKDAEGQESQAPTASSSDPSEASEAPEAAPTPKPTASKPTAKPAAKPSATKTASPKPAGTTAPEPAAPASGDVASIVALVNAERSKAGCSPVKLNAKLSKAAQAHSEDMASHKNMSHTGSDGSNPGTRITRAGYDWSTYGENVAYGYSSPESVMQGWMDSPGHKANILNCEFKEIGVGLAQPNDYWTQNFGTAR